MSVQTGMLLLVFCKVASRVMEVLKVTGVQARTNQVMEVGENGNVVTHEVESSPESTTVSDLFCHGVVRFFPGVGSLRSTFLKWG